MLGWKPDVVHSQCEFNTFGIAKRIARRLDIPLVHTYHTIYEDYTHYFSPNRKMGKSAAREFTRRICREVDHVIAPSEKTAALLREYEVESDVTVIPSGLVMDRFSHCGLIAKSTLGIPEDQMVLLYLGRLAKEKNLDEIFQYLQSWRGRAITFLIVGDGPYRGALEEQAKRLPESVTVRFTGMVPPDSVPSYYSLGDLFVSASQSETQGLTYIEAAAAGLPLLCRQDPCLKDVVVEGANGWQYQSKQDFLEKLKMFTETDFLRHNEMGICSKYLANRFDIRKTVPRIAEVYEASISQRKRKAGEFIHGCGECR